MSERPKPPDPCDWDLASTEQKLYLLDLATEVLEGLDELGVSTRPELADLMDRLERQIAEEG